MKLLTALLAVGACASSVLAAPVSPAADIVERTEEGVDVAFVRYAGDPPRKRAEDGVDVAFVRYISDPPRKRAEENTDGVDIAFVWYPGDP